VAKKKKKASKFKIDLGSNYVSNFIALIALILSCGAFYYSWKSDREKEVEIIRTNSERLITDERIQLFSGGYPDLIIPTYWTCDLTNNGENTISIVNYNIQRLLGKKNLMYYSNINFGLYSQDFKKIKLPLNIRPGETERILVKVGVSLYQNASDILKKELDSSVVYKFSDIKLILAKENTDIFDNVVKSKIQNDKISTIEYGGLDPNKDYYAITFQTGKGKQFVEILHWYPFLK